MGGPPKGPPDKAPHANEGEQSTQQMGALRGEIDALTCNKWSEHLPKDDNIILTDDDISRLKTAWDEKIADLVGGIPLELPPFREVNHVTNLVDPKKTNKILFAKVPRALLGRAIRENPVVNHHRMVGPHSSTPSGANVMHAKEKRQAKDSV